MGKLQLLISDYIYDITDAGSILALISFQHKHFFSGWNEFPIPVYDTFSKT